MTLRRIAARVAGRAVRATSGRRRWQPFWLRVHKVSLRARNIGEESWLCSGEAGLLNIVAARVGKTPVILDVGANLGGWSRSALEVWPAADLHAFEPSEMTYARLATELGDRATCVRTACGAVAGTAELHAVPGLSGLSSLHHRDLASHDLEMSAVETVEVITLDAYCAASGLTKIDFLKIDAEGHDLAVLEGARRLLDEGQIRHIQFEFGGANIDSRTFLRDFVRLLTPQYRIARVLLDGLEPLTYSELDEIFVTTNFFAELVSTPSEESTNG